MPIYEYKCNKCGVVFEEFQSLGATNEDLHCPRCYAPRPERIFSAFSSSGVSADGAGNSGGCGSSGSPFT